MFADVDLIVCKYVCIELVRMGVQKILFKLYDNFNVYFMDVLVCVEDVNK